ncbi:MAG: polysaccharide biosynthesis/export family protein [Muribaculaceae bacterium]|nr:polysaccharide biosynthesis/export family protein [Muribaculaceae bacterium]
MKAIHRSALAALVSVVLLTGCSAPKKVPYLIDAEYIPTDVLSQSQNVTDPVLTVGDLLNIQVTGVNMNAMAPFNKGKYIDTEGKIGTMSMANSTSNNYEVSTDYFLVNSDGNIDFPIIGKVHVAGLTKTQVSKEICDAIYPKYVTEKPSVDIRLMNFRVTVGGAVKSPGVYQSKNERMTFLEALSMAGDMDIKADRENILLYRVNPDGTREVHKLNIHDRNFLLSPYYNLQQNDYIYVQPNNSMRQNAWSLNPAVAATITIVGGLSSVASLVIGIVNLSK